MRYPKVERPTEPGWYWFRFYKDDPWQPVQVFLPRGCRAFRVTIPGILTESVRHVRGEWRGPIPQPEE